MAGHLGRALCQSMAGHKERGGRERKRRGWEGGKGDTDVSGGLASFKDYLQR